MEYVVVAFAVILAAYLAWEHWPRSPRTLYDHRLRKLTDDMRARGLSPEEQQTELQFRRAMVRLRRRASEATLASPSTSTERIMAIAKEEASRLGAIDKSLARRFVGVVDQAPLSDILYQDALKAVTKHAMRRGYRSPVSEDELAAVNTKR